MIAKIRYTDEPLGKLKVVPDFLPAPEELAFREEDSRMAEACGRIKGDAEP